MEKYHGIDNSIEEMWRAEEEEFLERQEYGFYDGDMERITEEDLEEYEKIK